MSQIAIIDPALGRTGAHNRGFAALLAEQGGGDALGIWCNNAIGQGLRDELAARNVTVQPAFEIDFYQIFEKQGGVADHWDWIYGLACQYLRAFEQILERWTEGRVHVVHHTLAWEHASALALAIDLAHRKTRRKSLRLHHLAFLMFSPGIDEVGHTFDADRALNYRLAFQALGASPGVRFYAGCGEYADAYARLLGQARPLPLHPCFLGDWRAAPPRRIGGEAKNVLLYLGEIKQEKGFLQLPKLLSRLVQTMPVHTRFVLQFVAVRNDAARKVLNDLDALANLHPHIDIHQGFWSDGQLRQALSTADVLYLNYDTVAYRHATSGLLWLAAWYGLHVVVPHDSWLEREATRLGVSVLPGPEALTSGNLPATSERSDNAYFRALFTPFPEWLKARCSEDSQSQASVLGADIVVFWKQNDTGLYGRRSDMIIRYLASRPDVRRVIMVDAPIGDVNLAKLLQAAATPTHNRRIHDEIQQKLLGARDTGKISYHVYVCPLAKFRFREDGTVRPHFIDGYAEYLAGVFAARQVDPAAALFWVYPTNFHAPQLIDRFKPARVVVDVEDDQRTWPGVSDTAKERLTANYNELLAMADMALTNCEPLRQSMSSVFSGIRLIPNGCDVDPPRAIPCNNGAYDEFIRFEGATIGFVGNLESKIDTVLLEKVADRFPDCQVVLLGSTHANPGIFSLSRRANICMPGVVPYPEVDAWLRKFDVGLVPHLNTELTRNMNPQKIYAYLSSHVPVVSTDVPNIPRDTDLVRVAASHEQFLEEIAQILAGDRPTARQFDEYVQANSWEARLAHLVDDLDLVHIAT